MIIEPRHLMARLTIAHTNLIPVAAKAFLAAERRAS